MLGLVLVLVAGGFFCFQNLIVRVLFTPVDIFDWLATGGFVEANLENSFLLLGMRTVLGVPIMGLVSPLLYRRTWGDVAQLRQPQFAPQRHLALAGGVLMFLYLALLYVAIGKIPAGIALTLFFTFPVFTALLSWLWFGDRPSLMRWGVMGLILLGSVLTVPPSSPESALSWVGVSMGVASGVAYAGYTVVAQKCFESFHPVPFTWISFAVTLVLSLLCLGLWPGSLGELPWGPLWVGALLSAIATFIGHVLNNLGIRHIGATAAAIVGSTNPALTALLAWVAIAETLSWLQGSGVLLVTLGVALLARQQHRA